MCVCVRERERERELCARESTYFRNRKKYHYLVFSGAVRFYGTRGEYSQWPNLTEIIYLKKSLSFIEFSFVWLSKLKTVQRRPGATAPLALPTFSYVPTYFLYL